MRWANPIIAGLLCALELTACSKLTTSDTSQDFYLPPQSESAQQEQGFTPAYNCGGTLTQEQRMYLELVYKMLKQGQYYAVLAHVDELEKQTESPQTFYLRAEAFRHLGQQDSAEKYYQLLLGGCMTGYGLHGLGLLATESNRLPEAETFLKHACRERPVDTHVHNDYGMVLLLRGRYSAAHKEFMTSLQLDRENRLPLENLIVLMLMKRHDDEARQLAGQYGLKDQDVARLRSRAQQLVGYSQIDNNEEGERTESIRPRLADQDAPLHNDEPQIIDNAQNEAPLSTIEESQTVADTQTAETPETSVDPQTIDDMPVDDSPANTNEPETTEHINAEEPLIIDESNAFPDTTADMPQSNEGTHVIDESGNDIPLIFNKSYAIEGTQTTESPESQTEPRIVDHAEIDDGQSDDNTQVGDKLQPVNESKVDENLPTDASPETGDQAQSNAEPKTADDSLTNSQPPTEDNSQVVDDTQIYRNLWNDEASKALDAPAVSDHKNDTYRPDETQPQRD